MKALLFYNRIAWHITTMAAFELLVFLLGK